MFSATPRTLVPSNALLDLHYYNIKITFTNVFFSYLFWHIIGNEEIDIGEKEVYFLKCSNVKLSIADRIVVNLKNHGRRLQKGGKCRQNVFDKWKTGELCYQLEAERNSHLEKELNYNALLTRSEEKVNCYKEKFTNLCRDDGKRGPTKSKSYGDLSRSQQFRIKKDIEKKCKKKLLFMEHFNFKATTAVICLLKISLIYLMLHLKSFHSFALECLPFIDLLKMYKSCGMIFMHYIVAYVTTKDVTPYIHAFANHVCEFLYQYHNISFFNQQGLEKLNDTTTKMFFRGTNMKGKDALKQL